MALDYGEISSLTQRYIVPKLIDNIFDSNVLLKRMREKNYNKIDGGTKITQPVIYAATSASGWFSGNDTLDTTANDQISSWEQDWKHIYVTISISRDDELKNSGKNRIIDFVKSKTMIAEKTIEDDLGTALFNDGTDSDALVGLDLAVDSAGTYGGISRTSYSWWAAQEDSSTTVLTVAAMQALFGDCTVGNDTPTIIVSTQDVFDDYHDLLQPQQRYMDKETANAGFENLTFHGKPFVVDSHCSSGYLYMLNEDYVGLYVHKDEDFRFDPFKKPVDQAITVAQIYWMGNLGISNCRMHGKMTAIA